MKNKIKYKRFLFNSLIILLISMSILFIVNRLEHYKLNLNYNKKVLSILSIIKENYPDIKEEELISIINSNSTSNILKKYGIDITNDYTILENKKIEKDFIYIYILINLVSLTSILIIFMFYERKKDKEISDITRSIENINHKIYTLEIDSNTEDELSILKNEIYKTTIMLKEQAENSYKDKIELKDSLSDISHQLKTPLTSIMIILDNLIENPDMTNEIRMDFLRDIKRETINISFLVQSILKLSKLESNTVSFIKEDVDIEKIIDEAIKNILPLCDLKNIEINKKIKKDIIVNCDKKWQVEAITNILKNCVEHSFDNSFIDIEVDNNKVYSKIIITNYESPISKDDLPHIFERFYKGKNSSKDSIGIGLALSKSIIEANNGSVYAESNEKRTSFIIKYYN